MHVLWKPKPGISENVSALFFLTEKGKAEKEKQERESELRDFLQTVQKIMA